MDRFYKLGVDLAVAEALGKKIGIDWDKAEFAPSDLQAGYDVELEHGKRDSETNVTSDDPETTARIAWAHLKEIPDYYQRLAKMEKKGDTEEGGGPSTPIDVPAVHKWLAGLGASPEDIQVHEYADEKGYNVHNLETVLYDLAFRKARNDNV